MSIKNYDEMTAEQQFAYTAGWQAAKRVLDEQRCRVCNGLGAIDGFWVGTIKTCPACHGKGHQ